ncbi:MAG TPA: hypothetical protein VLD67_04975 [Vicinamibacterales bacterium]|nr:hypothetical protein [Vicinamibacterales bacterium]
MTVESRCRRRAGPPAPGRRRCRRQRLLASAALAVSAVGLPGPSSSVFAEPLLRQADVRIVLSSPTSCEVTAVFSIDDADPPGIEHRIRAPRGVEVDLLAAGNVPVDSRDVRRQGATLSYVVPSGESPRQTYELRYRVSHATDWAYHCPIWLPAVPTDGRSRDVRLQVDLPPDAVPSGGSLPALTWSDGRGSTTIGHLPSFVRVPFSIRGQAPAPVRDLSSTMDAVAIVVLASASLAFFWRRRWSRGRGKEGM